MRSGSQRLDMVGAVIVALLVATAIGVLAQNGANPFVGSWKLDPVKSSFDPGPRPENRVTWFQVSGDSFTQIREQDDGFGSTQQMNYTARFDGKDYPVEGSVLDTVSLKRVNANTIERVAKIRAEVAETMTLTVSPDGKTLTMSAKGTTSDRQYNNVEIYERFAGQPPKR